MAPYWRSLEGLAGKGFLFMGQPREDPVSLFFPVILFSWIKCPIPQSSTENPYNFQTKDSHRSRDLEPLLLRVMTVVMPAWEGDSGGGCGKSTRHGEEKKYGRREVAAITAVYMLIPRTF